MFLPFEARPISPEDTRFLHQAFSRSGRRAWCYYAPFLCSYHLPPGREVLVGEWRGAVWVVQKSTRDQTRYDLVVPPLPFSAGLLGEFQGAVGGASRVLWAEEDDALAARDAGWDVREKEREYIYDPAAVAALEGPGYRDLRKRLRRCERNSVGQVRELRSEDLPACEALLRIWRKKQGRKRPFLLDWGYTRHALELYGAWQAPDQLGWVLASDGDVSGFALAGRMSESVASFFVLKGDPDVPGASDYLRWEVFCRLEAFHRVNDAGDLGLPGLRQQKMKFRPAEFLTVYTIEENGKEGHS